MTVERNRPRLSAWAPVVLWALFLFVMSSIPGDAFPAFPPGFNVHKLVHVALYAVLGALVWRGLRLTHAADRSAARHDRGGRIRDAVRNHG